MTVWVHYYYLLFTTYITSRLFAHTVHPYSRLKTDTFLLQSQVGGAWLAAFPALVATAWCAPPHVRHRYVTGGLAVLQSSALLGLAYLSLVSQRFLALSTVAPKQSARAGNVAGHKGLRAKLAVD